MTDVTPLERAVEEAKLRAAMARNPQPQVRSTVKPTLEQEYDAMVKAGIISQDDSLLPAAPTRQSSLNQDIADHVTDVVARILSAP